MKWSIYYAMMLATVMLLGCTQRPMLNEGGSSGLPKYYAYNPKDTIENYPFLEMLRIDSARVEFRLYHPVSEMPTINLDSTEGSGKTPEQIQHDNCIVLSEVEAKWYELMRLCAQKQYEEVLNMYIKEETDIGIALATSTNKFEVDYFVIGKLLFAQLDGEEAVEILSRLLEYDKLLTESVVAFSTAEGGSGYIPPQYAFQIDILCRTYLIMEDREKAEALIEPYRNAIYLLSDDVYANEDNIAKFKFDIYEAFGETEKVLETAIGYRDFLIQYAKDTGQEHDEEIESFEELIKEMKNLNK